MILWYVLEQHYYTCANSLAVVKLAVAHKNTTSSSIFHYVIIMHCRWLLGKVSTYHIVQIIADNLGINEWLDHIC